MIIKLFSKNTVKSVPFGNNLYISGVIEYEYGLSVASYKLSTALLFGLVSNIIAGPDVPLASIFIT